MILKLLSKYADCDSILLSGGVDSSAVAAATVARGSRPLGVVVSLRGCRSDLPYAAVVSSKLSIPLSARIVERGEAVRAAEEVVGILKVFNPMEVVNCAVVYLGLSHAASLGAHRVCTGDGGDELFLGYDFFRRSRDLERTRHDVVGRWRFCSFDIGKALGVEVIAPFTQREVVEYALSIPAELALGKRPLREELSAILPEVAAREKTPLERGSCFDFLYDEFRRKAGDEVAYLKAVFERIGLNYPTSLTGCPRCGYAGFDGRYCPMCGYYARGD
ncbi:Asparagine synthase (glutamine-hydrolyzing) [Pyrobaculum oguniense TE7]|uniref:Asparagine synthase (Glutamine-hydrolyzing) n=1 Tax=Pyrobaculum oguniense (strain DSM 13380 / JCM 10595 / TE7) TaxID=698757 RepID=H6QAA5_PYROT|nr:Asparagine synthase (glutamine-hydrolyzing) [Pyrobaculum oguniense TE7]